MGSMAHNRHEGMMGADLYNSIVVLFITDFVYNKELYPDLLLCLMMVQFLKMTPLFSLYNFGTRATACFTS